jgi:type IV secretion/conjugal transfer VirB4 family ATPase
MLGLKRFRSGVAGLPDLLNWAALIDNGIIQGKDGSLLAGWSYAGPDSANTSPEAREYTCTQINAALARLGSGWVSWHEAVRVQAAEYPDRSESFFPDRISGLIEEERRAQFEAEAAHFESSYAFFVMYTPPLVAKSRLAELVYDDTAAGKKSPSALGDKLLVQFKRACADLEDALSTVLRMERLGLRIERDGTGRPQIHDDLVNWLRLCLSGEWTDMIIPPYGAYCDVYMAGAELWNGELPVLGDKHICAVGIEGFPSSSFPACMAFLDVMPFAFRFSTRFIYLDQHEALTMLGRYRRQWRQKVRGFWSQVFRTQGGIVNEDALLMAAQSEQAMSEAQGGQVTYGFYTPVVLVTDATKETAMERARLVVRELRRAGFVARVETVNSMEAWLGSVPGHPLPNIRRPMVHTLNLSDLVLTSSIWTGVPRCPSPLYPPNSPPLLYAATLGATPFRLNLHVDDLGHTLIFGPTGAGKSVLLGTLAAQFLRYPDATVCCFDKGRSMWTLAEAVGGKHYDIGADEAPVALQPLAYLSTENELLWAADYIAICFELQANRPPTVEQRAEIHKALRLLASSPTRSFTEFCVQVQDSEIKSALDYYTIAGPLGHLLDANDEAGGVPAKFTVYELDSLMSSGSEKNVLPVLLVLFRWFERSLTGQPALLIIDEAWVLLSHPVFSEKIREWLKTLRKANCSVVLASQSLSDASKSGIMDVLMESTATKIFLPNEEACRSGGDRGDVLGPREIYQMFGLNDEEIETIRTATRKRQYYFSSSEGRRLFELGLGPVALAFLAVSDKETLGHLRLLKAMHGDAWPVIWLQERGVDYARLENARAA